MLIKGKKSTAANDPGNSTGSQYGAPGNDRPQSKPEPKPAPWTIENFEAGLVEDRRIDNRQERRRGFRRIEEKELISKAYEEANAIREQAKKEGFQEGLKQSESIVSELRDAIGKLLNAREEGLLSISDEIGALAVEVAERVIHTDVMCDNSVVLALVRETIQKSGRQAKTILVKVNPDDIALVKQSFKDDPIQNLKAELIVMEDGTVDQGSCIVETNSGLIDASFSTQLGILKQLFGTISTNDPS